MKRIVMYFTKYHNSKPNSNKYLQKLEENADYNFELCEIYCDEDNPIAEKYNVRKTPTYILLEKMENKEQYKEVRRLSGKVSNQKILDFLNDNKEY